MVFRSEKQGVFLLLSLGSLALAGCSSHNSTRYGGEMLTTGCVPVSPACQPVVTPVQYIPAPQYIISQQPIASPKTAQLPAPTPIVEPYVEPYVASEPALDPEPYVTPYRDLPPVDDDILIPCPEGHIKGYGGGDCIALTPLRK